MRRILLPLLAASMLLSASAQAAPRLTPDAQLDKALQGRVAGRPVDCISLRQVRSSTIIDDTAILYDTGSTIYVNRPTSGAESLNRSDVLVTRLFSDRLCSIDTVQLYDSASRFTTGSVFLGDFVPYRKSRTR